jgi:hypothetical protein
MSAYDTARKTLPPGTKSSFKVGQNDWWNDHAWYSYIGAYIEEVGLSKAVRFDLSFSDIANKTARQYKAAIFGCPSDEMMKNEWDLPADPDHWSRWRANYVVNWGNSLYGQTPEPTAHAPFSHINGDRTNGVLDPSFGNAGIVRTRSLSTVRRCSSSSRPRTSPTRSDSAAAEHRVERLAHVRVTAVGRDGLSRVGAQHALARMQLGPVGRGVGPAGLRERFTKFFQQALRRNVADRFDNPGDMLVAWTDLFETIDEPARKTTTRRLSLGSMESR